MINHRVFQTAIAYIKAAKDKEALITIYEKILPELDDEQLRQAQVLFNQKALKIEGGK